MDQSDKCYITEMIEVNIYTNFLLIYTIRNINVIIQKSSDKDTILVHNITQNNYKLYFK